MIEAKNVDFYYGDFHALKNISMTMESNTVTAFIGPSGCGKSTFLRLFNRMNDLIPGTRLTGECSHRAKHFPQQLSGGQQQRLCIARALAVSPSILLMDEPASALDPISTSKIEELIHSLKKEYTIVIVTHNMQQAARVSDKTGFFMLGELVEYNDTKKMFLNPDKVQTQNYITGRFG